MLEIMKTIQKYKSQHSGTVLSGGDQLDGYNPDDHLDQIGSVIEDCHALMYFV